MNWRISLALCLTVAFAVDALAIPEIDAARRHGTVAYFLVYDGHYLSDDPAQLRRYDMAAENWLAPVPLDGEGIGYAWDVFADDDGVFVLTTDGIWVLRPAGVAFERLVEFEDDVRGRGIVGWGENVFVFGTFDSDWKARSYRRTGGVVVAQTSIPSMGGFSFSRMGVVFGGQDDFSSVVRLTLNVDGTLTSYMRSLGAGSNSFTGEALFALPDGTGFISEMGMVFGGDEIVPIAATATRHRLDAVDYTPGGEMLTLQDGRVVRLDSGGPLPVDRFKPAISGEQLFVGAGASFVFGAPGADWDVPVEKVPFAAMAPFVPESEPLVPPVVATNSDLLNTSSFVDKRGVVNLALSSYVARSSNLVRWSETEGYLPSVPLYLGSGKPQYDPILDVMYIKGFNWIGTLELSPGSALPTESFLRVHTAVVSDLIVIPGEGLLYSTRHPTVFEPSEEWPTRVFLDPGGAYRDVGTDSVAIGSRSAWSPYVRSVIGYPWVLPVSQDGELGEPERMWNPDMRYNTPAVSSSASGAMVLMRDSHLNIVVETEAFSTIAELPPVGYAPTWLGETLYTARLVGGVSTVIEKWSPDFTEVERSVLVSGTPIKMLSQGARVYLVSGVNLVNEFRQTLRFISLSTDLDIVASVATAPAPAGLVQAVGRGVDAIEVTWLDYSDNEDAFEVFFREKGDSEWGSQSFPRDSESGVVTGLKRDTEYEFYVSAVNPTGTLADSDGPLLEARTLAEEGVPLGPPYEFTAVQIFGDAVGFHWVDNAHNETGFRIRFTSAGHSGEEEAPANAEQRKVNGLHPDTRYTFTIEAYNAAGIAEVSPPVVVETLRNVGVPFRPSISTPTVGVDWVRLTWTDLDNEDGYIIDAVIDGDTYEIGRLPYNSTEYLVENLTPGSRIEFSVRGYNRHGEGERGVKIATTERLGGKFKKGVTSYNGVAYFTFSDPDRVERFDLVSGQWLDPWPVEDASEWVGAGPEGIFVEVDYTYVAAVGSGGATLLPGVSPGAVTSDYIIGSPNSLHWSSWHVEGGELAVAELPLPHTASSSSLISMDGAPDTLASGYQVRADGNVVKLLMLDADELDRRYVRADDAPYTVRVGHSVVKKTRSFYDSVIMTAYDPDGVELALKDMGGSALFKEGDSLWVFHTSGANEHGMVAESLPASDLVPDPGKLPTQVLFDDYPDPLSAEVSSLYVEGGAIVGFVHPYSATLVRWSISSGEYLSPVHLGGLPVDADWWESGGGVYAIDAAGVIKRVPTGSDEVDAASFTRLGSPGMGLCAAGDHLVALISHPSDALLYELLVLDASGDIVARSDFSTQYAGADETNFYWDGDSRRIVFKPRGQWYELGVDGSIMSSGRFRSEGDPEVEAELPYGGRPGAGLLVARDGDIYRVADLPIALWTGSTDVLRYSPSSAAVAANGDVATIAYPENPPEVPEESGVVSRYVSEICLWSAPGRHRSARVLMKGLPVELLVAGDKLVAVCSIDDSLRFRAFELPSLADVSTGPVGPGNQVPSGPLLRTMTATEVGVTWEEYEGNVDSFVVEYFEGYEGHWRVGDEVPGDSNHSSISGLTTGEHYRLRVRARSGGILGAPSYEYRFTAGHDPDAVSGAPYGLRISSRTATSIIYQWDDNAEGETGFVLRSTEDPEIAYHLPAGTTEYTVTGLVPSTRYVFGIQTEKDGHFDLLSEGVGVRTGRFEIERVEFVDSGGVSITFPTVMGSSYRVQCLVDGDWDNCSEPILADDSEQVWIDRGPPATPSPPLSVKSRIYRIVEISEDP